ncbi:MAG: NADH-quinone oxidoreductase subunit M [Deltaproteobacteria bacterium]|nr:NADH-quinone oxidoreductase subunit M [Deltaproteobacteria bacterium]
MSSLLLPAVVFLPLLGVAVLLLIPREEEGVLRGIAFSSALLTFLVSLFLWTGFDTTRDTYQFVVDAAWIPGLNVRFKLGVDGISIWLVLLTTFLVPVTLLSATRAIHKKVKEFLISFLILETGMIGAFLALDLFLFYVMWEVMLIPMYFIIGIWGGERRVYASIKFVIFTLVGSLLMLVAIFYLYVKYAEVSGGQYTFDLEKLTDLQLARGAQLLCFAAFGLAFAIKVPLFPFHTWLPDAHVEAPTAGSVILAGVLLKFGVYGFLRFAMPLFPVASHELAPYLVGLAVIGIVYGALVAYAQDDVKKLVAYSSVSHLGFCVLGAFAVNPRGIEGSIYTMLSHGLTTGGLFLGIGVLYERRHTRKLDEFGGIWAKMPIFAAVFLIVTLGSAGLPGLSGFVGEFLSLVGAYEATGALPYPKLAATIAATGVILGAIYLLWMFQKVMFGPVTNERNQHLPDLSAREIAVFVPMVAFIFVLGMAPRPFLGAMEPSVNRLTAMYEQKRSAPSDRAYLLSGGKGTAPTQGASRGSESQAAKLAVKSNDPAVEKP